MDRPKVGVGVFVLRNGKILLGKRKNTHGDGSWGLPGGHLEMNESIEDCAIREVFEETRLKIKNIRLGPYTNDIFKEEGKHYITLFVISEHESGKVILTEPDKFEKIDWFSFEEIPSPLFLPLQNLFSTGFNPTKY